MTDLVNADSAWLRRKKAGFEIESSHALDGGKTSVVRCTSDGHSRPSLALRNGGPRGTGRPKPFAGAGQNSRRILYVVFVTVTCALPIKVVVVQRRTCAVSHATRNNHKNATGIQSFIHSFSQSVSQAGAVR